MPATSYGYDLSIGDDTDPGDIPVCCDTDMLGRDDDRGNRDYTCTTCGTVLTVAPSGLVLAISNR
jgi:hypothetical protein